MKKGTTLIEILVYFAILEGVLLAAMTFTIQIFNVNRLSTNFQEVQSNLDFISQRVIAAAQIANDLNLAASIFDNDQGALSLNTHGGITTFYLSNGAVFMREGTLTPVQLNSNAVTFDSLRFHRVTFPKSPDQIIIDASVRTAGGNIASQSKQLNFHISVSLRNL